MYCLLGSIPFDLLNAPTALSETHEANFAQHDTIDGKPKLQALGNNLVTLDLSISLHHQLGSVAMRRTALLAAKQAQQALPLIFGWWDYKGLFVIDSVSIETLYTDDNGQPLAQDISLRLREFVGDKQASKIGAALSLGEGSLLGSILPAGALSAISEVKQVIATGVKIFQQAKQIANQLNIIYERAKTFINDPATILSLFDDDLEQSIVNFADSVFNDYLIRFGDIIYNAAYFSDERSDFTSFLAKITNNTYELSGLIDELKSNTNTNNTNFSTTDWLDMMGHKILELNDVMQSSAIAVSKMTAWISLRGDEVYEPTNLS